MSDRHILVVDDEPDYRELIAEALRDGGFRVTIAADASTAMECLRSPGCDVDLVVTDVMMRHLSEGFDLIHEIRRQPERRSTPVVILSGFRELYDVSTQIDGEWLDCDALVDKPVSPETLVETVRSVLETRSGRV